MPDDAMHAPPVPASPASPSHAAAPARISRTTLWVGGLLLAGGAAAVVVTGVLARLAHADTLQQRAQQQALRTVKVISPAPAGAAAALDLPGRTEAWARAPLAARVGGYLKAWHADIGSRVKAGQLLAEIDTPEVDQQILQAQSELTTVRANVALAQATAKRWEELLASGMVTRQATEEKTGDLAAKQAQARALQANVERLQATKSFARITAPFDGVVTARNTDVGALVNAGSAAGAELFVVSDVRKLRIVVGVPQSLSALLRPGSTARVTVPERPGAVFTATVQATSQAIASGSGSMQVQLVVDNSAGQLLPGGFANVSFELPRGSGALAVPPSALIFGKAGLRVATLGPGDTVVLKTVTVARDLGTSIELASGLVATDRVIESPPDGVENGDKVRVAAPAPAKP
jgi:RND family efflux transporter MFP subunit